MDLTAVRLKAADLPLMAVRLDIAAVQLRSIPVRLRFITVHARLGTIAVRSVTIHLCSLTMRLSPMTFVLPCLMVLCILCAGCSCPSKPTAPSNPPDTTHADTTVVIYTYKIIHVYPHDTNAFTEGLVFENGFLYEGTGMYGGSSIRKVQLETGEILQIRWMPTIYFGEGITIYQNKIIQLTWRSGVGFIYDKASFDSLDAFYYPTEGWGLTYDGTNLIMSDGTSILRFWDPVTLAQVDSIEVFDDTLAVTQLNELEYVKGKIYANVWKSNRIAIISPQTGRVEGWIDLTGILNSVSHLQYPDVLNGIAYDKNSDRLFVTGKYWPRLYEIQIIPVVEPSSS